MYTLIVDKTLASGMDFAEITVLKNETYDRVYYDLDIRYTCSNGDIIDVLDMSKRESIATEWVPDLIFVSVEYEVPISSFLAELKLLDSPTKVCFYSGRIDEEIC